MSHIFFWKPGQHSYPSIQRDAHIRIHVWLLQVSGQNRLHVHWLLTCQIRQTFPLWSTVSFPMALSSIQRT